MAANQSVPPAVPKYALQPPARQRLSFQLLLRKSKDGLHALRVWTWHTIGFFEESPKGVELTLTHPAGGISTEMLPVCQHLANDAEERLSKLEGKATGLLSLIAVVIPLTGSAAVFIQQNGLPAIARIVTLGINVAAMLAFLLALLAALRAVAVRTHPALFLNAVVDPASDQVREYKADFYGRGLLHVAATRQAICDHIALFVRAAQLFLVLGVLLAASAAVPVLFYVHAETPATIHGTVSIEWDSLKSIRDAVADAASASDAEMTRLESEVQSMRAAQADAAKADVDRLTKEVEDLRKQIEAMAARLPATK